MAKGDSIDVTRRVRAAPDALPACKRSREGLLSDILGSFPIRAAQFERPDKARVVPLVERNEALVNAGGTRPDDALPSALGFGTLVVVGRGFIHNG